MTNRPYQVCLYVGPAAPALPDVRVVDLTPLQAEPAAVLERLAAAEVTPADLRSRVLFVCDGGPDYRDKALMVYAALLGFAKRRLDLAVSLSGDVIETAAIDAALRAQPDAGRPTAPVLDLQVGGQPREDLAQLHLVGIPSRAALSTLRYARRVRFVPDEQLQVALTQFVALAAVRARGNSDRFPTLCTGTEALEHEGTLGVDLDGLRREAESLRRSLRSDNREAIAEPAELTERQRRLVAADLVPVEQTLTRLQARSKVVEVPARPDSEDQSPTTVELWHCPRPQRHSNGDATPSARVHAKTGTFQCYRCDPERVGSLRLVMDVHGVSPDEAADWILTA